MAKKKKNKLKKFGAALAAGLGAAALMRGKRDKAIDAGIAAAEADKGSDMFIGKKDNRGNTAPMFDYGDAFSYMPMKKGGRVGVGKAKRGFGRAMMKKGKK
jgi:hypothetical protein